MTKLLSNETLKSLNFARWRDDELAHDDGGRVRWPHAVLWASCLIGFVGLVWANLAEIDEITRGEGKVITASQTQLVQNLEGGIVSKIFVKEGDLVERDQLLFQLDDVRFSSAFREGAQTERGLKAKVARLQSEVSQKGLSMPAEVSKDAPELAANELAVYRSRQQELSSRLAVLREQLTQRSQEVLELSSRRDRSAEQLELLKKEIAITAPLVKQGAISDVELMRLQRDSARLQQDYEGALLALPRTRAAVEEAKRKIEEAGDQFRAQAAAELSMARNELAKQSETVPGLQDRLTRTQVRSPARGYVKTIMNKTVGGVVQPGTPLAEIVAAEDALIVEVRIRPQDVGFVHIGDKALVKLTGYDYSIYGSMDGKIVHLSADSVQPQAQPGQPAEAYYIAHVRTTKPSITYQGKELPVIPGMNGQVDVLTGKRTVMHYLLKPINKTAERALTER
jgi:adhesin transport system membrane fusion protein